MSKLVRFNHIRPLDEIPHNSKDVRLSPKDAGHVLETMFYQGQRPERGATIANFGVLIDDGAFRSGSQICIAQVNDTKRIVNGHHRLTVTAEGNKSQSFTITTYKCLNIEEVHALYISFDSGIGTRSKADMFAAFYGRDLVKAVGKQRINALITAVGPVVNDFAETFRRAQAHHVARYCYAAYNLLPQLKQFEILLRNTVAALRTRLHKKSVLAIALTTWKYQPKRAQQFWTVVARGGSGRVNDPRSLLREFLIVNEPFRKRTAYAPEKPYTDRQLTHIVAWCWNAFFTNKRTSKIEPCVAVSRDALYLEGTPVVKAKNSGARRKSTALLSAKQRKSVLKHAQRGKTPKKDAPDYRAGSTRIGQQVLPQPSRRAAS